MKFLISLIITSIFSILQSLSLPFFSKFTLGVSPDISLVSMILFGMYFGRSQAMFTGFFSGLIEDFLSIAPLGYYALIKTLIGSIFGSLRSRVFIDSLPIALIIISLATLAKYLITKLLNTITNINNSFDHIFSINFLIEIIFNNIFAIPLYFLVSFIIKHISHLWKYSGDD